MMMTNDTTVEVYKAIRGAVTESMNRFLDAGEDAGAIAEAALDAILAMTTLQGVDVDTLKRMQAGISDELRINEEMNED
jgi:hypothetical protein